MIIPFLTGIVTGVAMMCGAIALVLWLFPTIHHPKIIENPLESLVRYYKQEIERLSNEKSS